MKHSLSFSFVIFKCCHVVNLGIRCHFSDCNSIASTTDRVRKIYEAFPRINMPYFLGDDYDDDGQKLSEAISAAKVRSEGCSSFLRAALR